MNRAVELSRAFVRDQPASAAHALDQISSADVAAFVINLEEEEVAQVMALMQPLHAAAVLEQLAPAKAVALLNHAPAYARSLLMRALSPPAQQAVLKAAPRRQAAVLSRYLSYDPSTVGAWMEAPHATFPPHTRIGDCLRQLRGLGGRLSSSVFVIDDDHRLLGAAELDALLAAADTALLSEVMRRDVVSIAPQASLGSIVALEAWDSTLALPVTDHRRRLVGSLRFESLREGLDIQHGAGGELRINMVVMHMAQAFLISLSGLLQVAATEPGLSRLSNEPEER
ncbi:MAG: CBS domain-containing protein [Kiloniellaceae bacterium]